MEACLQFDLLRAKVFGAQMLNLTLAFIHLLSVHYLMQRYGTKVSIKIWW